MFCAPNPTYGPYVRKKHPGQRNSLDALCKRYSIDNSHRELHGALLDSEILADVYLLMTGGQSSLLDEDESHQQSVNTADDKQRPHKVRPALTVVYCNEAELAEHREKLEAIRKTSSTCLWT